MRCACLVDTTRCIGCRSCQVACKQSNRLDAEKTRFSASPGGYQNPRGFSPRTFTYISFHELEDAAGGPAWVFLKHQCMHCTDLYCATVCGADVFHKTETGVVTYDADKCMGCAACMEVCPFHVPAIDYWDLPTPYLRKCGFCLQRQQSKIEAPQIDGKPLEGEALRRYERSVHTPACAKACPSGAIQFGPRDRLIEEARRRIAAAPDRYVNHIYGLTEAGGTGWLYLASVPFEKLGLPTKFASPEEAGSMKRMGSTRPRRHPLAWLSAGLSTLAAGFVWLAKRRDRVRGTDP